jgi:hypothetical protein
MQLFHSQRPGRHCHAKRAYTTVLTKQWSGTRWRCQRAREMAPRKKPTDVNRRLCQRVAAYSSPWLQHACATHARWTKCGAVARWQHASTPLHASTAQQEQAVQRLPAAQHLRSAVAGSALALRAVLLPTTGLALLLLLLQLLLLLGLLLLGRRSTACLDDSHVQLSAAGATALKCDPVAWAAAGRARQKVMSVNM